MLVLSRRKDEDIVIHTSDGPIRIKVTKVGTTYVSLGIDAPKHVKISRGEHAEDKQ